MGYNSNSHLMFGSGAELDVLIGSDCGLRDSVDKEHAVILY